MFLLPLLLGTIAFGANAQPNRILEDLPANAQIALERAAKCGVHSATSRYEEELQSDIITVRYSKQPSWSQLACLDKAVGFGIFVELAPTVQPRFDAIREARATKILTRVSKEWLAARGLLAKVPRYKAGVTDDASFTRALEQLCGSRAKGAFQSEYGFDALSPEWVKSRDILDGDKDVFACLGHGATVAGFKFGIIGNAVSNPALSD